MSDSLKSKHCGHDCPDLLSCDLCHKELQQVLSSSISRTKFAELSSEKDQTFRTISECRPKVKPLDIKSDKNIFIPLKIPLRSDSTPEPYPVQPYFNWNKDFVKMPLSQWNRKVVEGSILTLGTTNIKQNWDRIERALSKEIHTFAALDECVKKYNENLRKFDYDVLRIFLDDPINFPCSFDVINAVRRSVLETPRTITQSIPMLKKSEEKTIVLSRKQIACLLANAFFCTFPRRSKNNQEYQDYPTFNFSSLYSSKKSSWDLSLKVEKLKCIFSYFKQTLLDNTDLIGVVSFERRFLNRRDTPIWAESEKSVTKLKINLLDTIEAEGSGFTEVNFANRYVGGGVLNSGCLQEEIRFLDCPELIVARLFTEVILDDEALIVTGCAQYNSHQGFDQTFKWFDEHREDITSTDGWGRLHKQIVMIDAQEFGTDSIQYQYDIESIERDLIKAFCGFLDKTEYELGEIPAIATGKWGCGAFNGDPYLKSLIQMIAASEAERNVVFFAFNDKQLAKELEDFFGFIDENDIKIKEIFNAMKKHKYPHKGSDERINYLKFIKSKLEEKYILVEL